jgi:hypothetical protein
MRRILFKKIWMLFFLLPALLPANEAASRYLENYLRVRGDLSGAESLYYLQGSVYSMIPGEKSMELFGYEGYVISRLIPEDSGYRLLSKEVGFFLDHRTKAILEDWRNPFTQETLPVIHIWNDPVNQSFEYSPQTLPYIRQFLPSVDMGESLVYHNEIFPFFPHPLSRRQYGEYVQSDHFQSAEISQYRVSKSALADSLQTGVPAELTSTWIMPWMPFMKMADREGHLIFSLRGRKLDSGFSELPQKLRDYVLKHQPDFAHAPTYYYEPNMNPWSYFKLLREGPSDTSDR